MGYDFLLFILKLLKGAKVEERERERERGGLLLG